MCTQRIETKFGTDIHSSQMMNPNDFSDTQVLFSRWSILYRIKLFRGYLTLIEISNSLL